MKTRKRLPRKFRRVKPAAASTPLVSKPGLRFQEYRQKSKPLRDLLTRIIDEAEKDNGWNANLGWAPLNSRTFFQTLYSQMGIRWLHTPESAAYLLFLTWVLAYGESFDFDLDKAMKPFHKILTEQIRLRSDDKKRKGGIKTNPMTDRTVESLLKYLREQGMSLSDWRGLPTKKKQSHWEAIFKEHGPYISDNKPRVLTSHLKQRLKRRTNEQLQKKLKDNDVN